MLPQSRLANFLMITVDLLDFRWLGRAQFLSWTFVKIPVFLDYYTQGKLGYYQRLPCSGVMAVQLSQANGQKPTHDEPLQKCRTRFFNGIDSDYVDIRC